MRLRKTYDGDSYFDPAVYNAVVESCKSVTSSDTIIHISPDEFLALALLRKDYEKGVKLKGVLDLLDKGMKFNEIPYLVAKTRKDFDLLVIGHEGRHRALALKELGVKKIPVVLKSRPGDGPTYRWNATAHRPKKMYSQTIGHAVVDMPSVDIVK